MVNIDPKGALFFLYSLHLGLYRVKASYDRGKLKDLVVLSNVHTFSNKVTECIKERLTDYARNVKGKVDVTVSLQDWCYAVDDPATVQDLYPMG